MNQIHSSMSHFNCDSMCREVQPLYVHPPALLISHPHHFHTHVTPAHALTPLLLVLTIPHSHLTVHPHTHPTLTLTPPHTLTSCLCRLIIIIFTVTVQHIHQHLCQRKGGIHTWTRAQCNFIETAHMVLLLMLCSQGKYFSVWFQL